MIAVGSPQAIIDQMAYPASNAVLFPPSPNPVAEASDFVCNVQDPTGKGVATLIKITFKTSKGMTTITNFSPLNYNLLKPAFN